MFIPMATTSVQLPKLVPMPMFFTASTALSSTYLEYLLSVVQFATDTKEKRHIVGGMLVSISLLFGGMAFTVMTMKDEDENYE